MIAAVVVPAVAAVAVLLSWFVLLAASRVRRLDRLHRRLDGARGALDAALARRARLAVGVAAALGADGAGVAAALAGAGSDAEADANALGRALARVDRDLLPMALAAECDDAGQLLALARRVHNDAVRDTLVVRRLWMVRCCRLAGRAPMPAYFEIIEVGAMRGTARGPVVST